MMSYRAQVLLLAVVAFLAGTQFCTPVYGATTVVIPGQTYVGSDWEIFADVLHADCLPVACDPNTFLVLSFNGKDEADAQAFVNDFDAFMQTEFVLAPIDQSACVPDCAIVGTNIVDSGVFPGDPVFAFLSYEAVPPFIRANGPPFGDQLLTYQTIPTPIPSTLFLAIVPLMLVLTGTRNFAKQ